MLKELMESAKAGELNGTIEDAFGKAGMQSFTEAVPYNINAVGPNVDLAGLAKGVSEDFANQIAQKLSSIGLAI